MTIIPRIVECHNKFQVDKILYPIRPFHVKLEEYLSKRDKIFNIDSFTVGPLKPPKRSTLRLRNYFKLRKQSSKFIISSLIKSPQDKRYYAKVGFLSFIEYGLLDTGANVTCIGSDLAKYDFSKLSAFSSSRTNIKTADGTLQKTLGMLEVDVSFKDQTHRMNILVVPSLSQRLILGLDFWKVFKLAADIFESAIVLDTSVDLHKTKDLSALSGTEFASQSISNIEQNSESKVNTQYPLTPSQRQQLNAIIDLFPNFEKDGLGRTSLIEHNIDVGSAKPIKQKFYPVSPAVERLMFQEIDRMLSLGVIEESSSPWSSPMRLVLKPNKVRLCLDARKVNSLTEKDAYPLPNIDGIFSRLPKANLISKLDLKDAYWQIGLTDESKPLTAFTVPGRPLYQFTVMPFGLCTAPQTMCRLMDQIIPPELKYCVFGYLDDLIIISEDFSSHLSVLVRIAEQFRKANLTLNVSKSSFCVTQVKYLGYVIGCGGIKTDPEKIDSILNWPVPKNLKQVRGFLGIAGWYRRFIENFSTITFPITEVLSTKRKFQWTESAEVAFKKIKNMLTRAPVLSNPDFLKKFYLHCDASDYGIGAVLVQHDKDGCEKPIAYMSKKLNSAQRNYSVTERECLAAVEAIHKFRCYLELQEFEVITDHSSLVWLMKQPNLTGRLARWVFKLQSYKFTISHRQGKNHIVPDALSRMYCDEVSSIELAEAEIDLNSEHFKDKDYEDLKNRIQENEEKYPDIKIVDSFVYIRTEHTAGDPCQEENSWKLWIPTQLRNRVITRAHCSAITVHGGMQKTLELIRRNFYWPGMVMDVRNFVRQCTTCKQIKYPNVSLTPEMGQQAVSIRPFQRLYVDLLGPYPRSKNGNIGLLIVLDHHSKFHWLCPLRKFSSSCIQNFLLTQIFHTYGVPETIISDNGSQFRANEFQAFLTKLGISHVFTALYSPQSNASERVNRSIIAGIRSFLKDDQRLWDENISSISCALRNSFHQAIKCSPYHALFGMDMITHGSSYKLLAKTKLLSESINPLTRDDQLAILRKDLRKNMQEAYESNKNRYDLRTRPNSFSIGQEVFRRNFSQSNFEKRYNAKLAPVFIKSKIREKIGNHYYVLEDSNGKVAGTFHAKDIRS